MAANFRRGDSKCPKSHTPSRAGARTRESSKSKRTAPFATRPTEAQKEVTYRHARSD